MEKVRAQASGGLQIINESLRILYRVIQCQVNEAAVLKSLGLAGLDFHDFYTLKSLWVGFFGAKIFRASFRGAKLPG
jgi:hypothetical protein